jgi:hypothetical protein
LAKKPPPKKTGSRGIKPLEYDGDLTAQDEARTKKDLETLDKPSPGKGSLLAEQPPKPKVVGDRFEAFYLKPIYSKNSKGVVQLGLRITAPIEKEHEKVLPKIMSEGFKATLRKGCAGQKLRDIPVQRVSFFLTNDDGESALVLEQAQIIQSHIDVVQRRGEGTARKVHRLSFVAQVKADNKVSYFADKNLANTFWLQLEEVEPDLLDLDDEDDE